jgi:cell division GTPase FtsZ
MTDAKSGIAGLRPHITVIGVGGGGGNAINNMIAENLAGVEFIAANTDAQVLATSKASRRIQLGANVTEGLGAGSLPEVGARLPRSRSMRSWIICAVRTCASSRPEWAAEQGRVPHR